MKTTKFIKTYVIMVSRQFPAYHSKKGQKTYFKEKIEESLGIPVPFDYGKKIHTFRGNYPLWKSRIDQVLAGTAIIVLKYHTLGKYVNGNQQVEFMRFDRNSGIGIEKARFIADIEDYAELVAATEKVTNILYLPYVAQNDGLQFSDFTEWFKKGDYDMSEPFACIHFTEFRYGGVNAEVKGVGVLS